MKPSIGILGVGTYLPPTIRTNDYWPDHVTKHWKERAARRFERMRTELEKDTSDVGRMTLEAVTALLDDPFQGARERRVIADDMKSSDMETIAAREAIARAGIPMDEIDLVMSQQICPDYIDVPSAAVVHGNLGLRERCQAVVVDAACNSFLHQLMLAQAMIATGRARYALLTQSSALTRFPESGEVIDSWNGDAGSAVIVGPVSEGRGIIGDSTHTNGKLWGTLVVGVPGGRWHDGPCTLYSENPRSNLDWVVNLSHRAAAAVAEALANAQLTTSDVNFFASHQGFKWLHPVQMAAARVNHAKSVEHFHFTGAISSVNLPLQLAIGEKEGILKPNDVVACFQGGGGMTWSAMVLRWGT